MGNRWTPKWKKTEIDVDGKKYEVCYDEVTRLYACPMCSPVCLNGGIPDHGSYFFHQADLVKHIKAHKYSLWTKKRPAEAEEEEEEEEGEED
ncbi:MAG: hypothetical protein MPF33_03300 [Candidatus Aramenus sp.]|jgi:hypothetical protein|nr:hypothetical protein [Candidatus Aramenus sp.]